MMEGRWGQTIRASPDRGADPSAVVSEDASWVRTQDAERTGPSPEPWAEWDWTARGQAWRRSWKQPHLGNLQRVSCSEVRM